MTLLDALPEPLRARAYVAGSEGAWSRSDALEVIDYIASIGAVTCRIEIWLPTEPGPTIPAPGFYAWELQEPSVSSPMELVGRSQTLAAAYVAGFAWDDGEQDHADLEPYFNIDAVGGSLGE